MQSDYSELNVLNTCTDNELKTAFRKMAMKYHPDKNDDPESIDKFNKMSKSYYTILESRNNGTNNENGTNNNNCNMNAMFSNLFSNLFVNDNDKKGNDIFIQFDLSFEDIYNGCTKTVMYKSSIINDSASICHTCNGNGKITSQTQLGPIIIPNTHICNNCEGCGYYNLYLDSTESYDLVICKGFNYKQKLIIKDKGFPYYKYASGDLIFLFNLKQHKFFKLKRDDLYISLNITFKESLIGLRSEIKQLDSRIIIIDNINDNNNDNNNIQIIKPNMIKIIENEGMYNNENRTFGNLYIKFKVDYPNELSEHQKKIISEFF